MSDWMSDVARFRCDSDTGVLTDISEFVNNVTINGGNEPVDNTGLGQSSRSEQGGLGTIQTLAINGYVNSTTEAIFGSILNGTSATKTVEYSPNAAANKFYVGEATTGPVSMSAPIGLQTFTCEFRAASGSGFARTSVAAS